MARVAFSISETKALMHHDEAVASCPRFAIIYPILHVNDIWLLTSTTQPRKLRNVFVVCLPSAHAPKCRGLSFSLFSLVDLILLWGVRHSGTP